jgi:phosphoenolpyruvate carboxykinase (GTP)
VDVDGWLEEVALIREHFARFGDKLPAALAAKTDDLEARLQAAKAPAGAA